MITHTGHGPAVLHRGREIEIIRQIKKKVKSGDRAGNEWSAVVALLAWKPLASAKLPEMGMDAKTARNGRAGSVLRCLVPYISSTPTCTARYGHGKEQLLAGHKNRITWRGKQKNVLMR
jgi:hypothetical protein